MLKYEELQEGQELHPLVKPAVTKVQLVRYAGASGDFNPLHTDDEFAQSIGMPGVIAHGMLVMGFLGEYVNSLAGVTATVSNLQMRFGAITRPGDEITCSAVIRNVFEEDGKRLASLELNALKAAEKVVGSGKAILQFF